MKLKIETINKLLLLSITIYYRTRITWNNDCLLFIPT